eukprot:TRINITY_DN17437_c0_g1_i2.p1 TRINITY_DN17437_c0_g1~~TRINITY_DN17437_c0_g1_i2.p1  ORF type:complete len:972 (+),score=252.14 TRINITY_DN17437_c0_g1_i2:51-2966(+)
MDVECVEQKTILERGHRGKLYVLSDDAWEDKGTASVTIISAGESKRLSVRDESSGASLHDRPVITSEDSYRLQGEGEVKAIIVWEDEELQMEFALSFEDPRAAAEVFSILSARPGQAEQANRLLPLPELGNLPELARLLSCAPPSQRERLAMECIAPRFVEDLRQAFRTAEDASSEADLLLLWRITKSVFMLSNHKATERYLRRDLYDDVMGMLEYDEGIPADQRVAHRHMLKVAVRFKQVLAFEDAEMLERIHLNYRLQYLKDFVLARVLDDSAFASLTQLININNTVLLNHLSKSENLMKQLFHGLAEKDLQSLLFLQDACRLAKVMPPSHRQGLYENMLKHGLFSFLAPFFAAEERICSSSEVPVPRHLAMEVLLLSALSDASHLRTFLVTGVGKSTPLEEECSAMGRSLLSGLVRLAFEEEDQGVQSQAAEVLRHVMDQTQVNAQNREGFLDTLYGSGVIDEIVAPLKQTKVDVRPHSLACCYALQLVCELLAFVVMNHGPRGRAHILQNDLLRQAAVLATCSGHRFLKLAPLRLVKAILNTKDAEYLSYLTECGIFDALLRNFDESLQLPALGGSLLASASAELLDLVRTQNVKSLVAHLCTQHAGILQKLVPRIKAAERLLLRHRQNLEQEAAPQKRGAAALRRRASTATPGEDGKDLPADPGLCDDSSDDEEAEAFFGSLVEADSAAGLDIVDEVQPQEHGGVLEEDEASEGEESESSEAIEDEEEESRAPSSTDVKGVNADAAVNEEIRAFLGNSAEVADRALEGEDTESEDDEDEEEEDGEEDELVEEPGNVEQEISAASAAGQAASCVAAWAKPEGPRLETPLTDSAAACVSQCAEEEPSVTANPAGVHCSAAMLQEEAPASLSSVCAAGGEAQASDTKAAAVSANSQGSVRTSKSLWTRMAARAARLGAAAAAAASVASQQGSQAVAQQEVTLEDASVGKSSLSHASKRARMESPAPIPA